jgi:hypothetical protein
MKTQKVGIFENEDMGAGIQCEKIGAYALRTIAYAAIEHFTSFGY